MQKLLAKKLNKKGFTLAELLIVVAIIAVLVAIAIPIFTGAMDKARLGVHRSNARNLKSMAVSVILGDPDLDKNISSASAWKVVGEYNFISQTFSISSINIYDTASSGAYLGVYSGDTLKKFGDQGDEDAIGKLTTATSAKYEAIVTSVDLANVSVSWAKGTT